MPRGIPNTPEQRREAKRLEASRRRDAFQEKFGCRNNRDQRLRSKYGITFQDYEQAYVAVGGKCQICMTHQPVLHVDHDHQIGHARGLLCNACNRALGGFKDDPEILGRALEYARWCKAVTQDNEALALLRRG